MELHFFSRPFVFRARITNDRTTGVPSALDIILFAIIAKAHCETVDCEFVASVDLVFFRLVTKDESIHFKQTRLSDSCGTTKRCYGVIIIVMVIANGVLDRFYF